MKDSQGITTRPRPVEERLNSMMRNDGSPPRRGHEKDKRADEK